MVTIVRAAGRRLAKRVWPDRRIDDYNQAKTVNLFERSVASLADLGRILDSAASESSARPWCDRRSGPGPRRPPAVHRDEATGDRPTLVESSRRWLALGIDRLMLPPELAATHLSGCGELAIAALPKPFSPASVILQATAGHLIKPGARLRLWFWLSRPVTQSELKLWLRSAPVDVAVFRPAQLIFTAARFSPMTQSIRCRVGPSALSGRSR
jgi:hypothetical protein